MLADVNCVLTKIAVGGRGFPNGVRRRERGRERRREGGHGERERRVRARERKANITSTHVCTNTELHSTNHYTN